MKKLKPHGFNNLTKTLSFNIYDICYHQTPHQRKQYIEYIDEVYNAERLTHILTDVASIIGANILNIAHQDYDPQGASVTMLISEEPVIPEVRDAEAPGPLPRTAVAHLDKSHITMRPTGHQSGHYLLFFSHFPRAIWRRLIDSILKDWASQPGAIHPPH